jgi:hypothetical protein
MSVNWGRSLEVGSRTAYRCHLRSGRPLGTLAAVRSAGPKDSSNAPTRQASRIEAVFSIYTHEKANFVLRLQWMRLTDDSNSGIYVRFPNPDSIGFAKPRVPTCLLHRGPSGGQSCHEALIR